ncbi:GNAT family N-acetyltransferase [Maribacter ulvicola]|uniref:Ribosomal protein S18 acetylase RimI n=1 Tax=Maribacter ulvicola TaxID=228959 RepID=A0A1N6YSP2_9FLAO|nr:GNAT family N-acetyltransferase [Maribacter ulvicola]SIR17625.1 Ribosomal protein S18 acetylase RimI [Maribacter ulvicola]
MTPKIIEITADATLLIRHQVMWPNKPIDYVKLPKDDEGKHYGLFLDGKLISVISLFVNSGEAQFRKFATLKIFQGKGYGSLLLKEIMLIAKKKSITRIWCNARLNKSDFYTKFGMKETHKTYVKGGIDFIIMERFL